MKSVRIAFLGLGGVGGYFGAKLSATFSVSNDVEVIFLAREKTAEAIRRNGIRLVTPAEEFTAQPHAISTPGNNAGAVDFLICTVKSYDLEESLQQFSSCINAQTIILPLQNGIDAKSRIQKLFPKNEIWSGCVYIVSRIAEPGVIREMGNIHSLYFGSKAGNPEKLQQLYRILKSAHEDIFLSDRIDEVVWEKYVFISAIASLTSYLDVSIGKILDTAENRSILLSLLEEITSVAHAERISLPADIIPLTLMKMEKLPYETTSSMHSDFRSGNKTEIQSLTGHVVELASHNGIKVPVYEKILQELKQR